jgi:hypothetical protein
VSSSSGCVLSILLVNPKLGSTVRTVSGRLLDLRIATMLLTNSRCRRENESGDSARLRSRNALIVHPKSRSGGTDRIKQVVGSRSTLIWWADV